MNVPLMKQTSVTQTHCVQTLKDPISVAVSLAFRETEETAQVKIELSPNLICLNVNVIHIIVVNAFLK